MPLAETEVLPIVQSATTKKVTVAELTTLIKHTMTMDSTNALQFGDAGFTASINYNGDGSLRIKPRAGYPVQVDLANIKFSNAGYGIDFSAATHAAGMTSELLNDYEEGTWTPNVAFLGGTSSEGTYTKIGRQVTIRGSVTGTALAVGTTGIITNDIPFNTANVGAGAMVNAANNQGGLISVTGPFVVACTPITSTATIIFTATYFV